MEGWVKIAGVAFTATIAAVVAIAAFYESQRQRNDWEYWHAYGNSNRERANNDEFNATITSYNQRSQNSTTEAKLREAELKRAEKLAKLREERKRQLEEEEKKRKKAEEERKRKREEEEKERKKNEEMKSMLDSFDDVFDIEIGVKTERVHVNENIDDWSRNAEKQKLKEEFRAKQMAQQQKSQDEKDQINSNNRTDDVKIGQQKSTVKKCVIDKKFKIREFLLNAIISVNIENSFSLALSLRSIKKNKNKKVIDLQELESAVFILQEEILQGNESSKKTGAIPKSLKRKVKKKKTEKQTDTQIKQENKLETEKNSEDCKQFFVHKNMQNYLRKLELEEKKKEEVIAEWKLRRKLRQQYHKLEPTKSFQDHSIVAPLQKQLENQKRKVNLIVNKRTEAENMNSKPNFYDDQIVYEMQDPYHLRLNQLSELMFQTKNNFGQYQVIEDEKQKINKYREMNKSKIVTRECTISKDAHDKKFKCPKFLLYAIININTTNKDTVAASLRGIEKNKRKKVIDLQELESAVNDLQEISYGAYSLQDHVLPENITKKVKKPKTKEQIAARKERKQLRKQKGNWKQKTKIAVCG